VYFNSRTGNLTDVVFCSQDLHTDDDLSHGGKQVTVFVTNDGVKYSAGYDETWDPHSGSLPGVELAVSVHFNSRKTLTGDY
jgi:hypothetical protein